MWNGAQRHAFVYDLSNMVEVRNIWPGKTQYPNDSLFHDKGYKLIYFGLLIWF
jgi:hypothetical protein